MPLTALKKLLHRISRKTSPKQQKLRAETSESRAVSDMTVQEYGYTAAEQTEAAVNEPSIGILPNETGEASVVQADAPSTEELINSDVNLLKESFSELSGISGITELPNPTRYAALRDLGLTPEEAYLATAKRPTKESRSHLISSVPRGVSMPKSAMNKQEMQEARALFGDMDDNEIHRLYKRVTN